MHPTLSLTTITALFSVMVIGAFIPSVSTLAVVARSATYGFSHGLLTTLGIVVGDMVFILIAIYGLSILADLMGDHFYLIQYLGGAYLILLGIMLWRSKTRASEIGTDNKASFVSSYMTGMLITLGDQKAILFYLGFFPAFIHLITITIVDTGIILLVTLVGVGSPKLVYAFMANKASKMLQDPRATHIINQLAGTVMIGVGLYLFIK